jgi:hypothetical protein
MSLTEDDKKWIKDQLTEQRVQLEQRIERVETNLLTEFYKWASPVEARQRSHAAALHALTWN